MDIKEYGDRLTTLVTRYLAEGASALEAYARAVAEAFSGSGRTEDLEKRYTRIALRDAPELARKLAQCNMDYYKGIVDTGFNFGTEFLETTAKKAAQSQRAPGKRKRTTKR